MYQKHLKTHLQTPVEDLEGSNQNELVLTKKKCSLDECGHVDQRCSMIDLPDTSKGISTFRRCHLTDVDLEVRYKKKKKDKTKSCSHLRDTPPPLIIPAW